ncbi:precorrin-3B synthase [Knoellia sinensis KCTC 19936]|uniref:Precorrin-3B synthase n=1 Tax=Knoellia sinensis KCTC 19936 TaxID=1385520 RepID=A0A0A0J3L6_9MICO|nr:cobalamin biosynthesis protein CobG [Knoellia sinensis]KGN31935.1 precorrin-3B synthase [Knoellia sinensis KCTC 19936]
MSDRAPLDRCPGLLRPFLADDGALVRLRMPGGRVATSVLADVASLAGRFGAPVVQLTSRGNLQLRALPSPLPPAFVEAIEATGLLPSATHERVRNIVAAPLARELDPVVEAFDLALRANPRLAALPGRFLFAFSDASGSVLSERWDVAYQQLTSSTGVLYAGQLGREVRPADAVGAMIGVARRFVESAPEGAWNVRDLPDDSPVFDGLDPRAVSAAAPLRPGVAGSDVVCRVPLGMLTAEQVDVLADVADTVVVTPWRSIVVPGGADRADTLLRAGLVTEPEGPWARISACVGAPSCRRTTVTTLDLARSAVEMVASRQLTVEHDVHVVGCERRCGTGTSDRVLVAPPTVDEVVTALTAPAEQFHRGEQ